MSVLIKGFEMPKDGCKDCAMVKRGKIFDTCPFLRQEVNGNVERGGKPNGCPLIDVTDTNVGDMISRQDAIDAVYERIRRIGYDNNPLVLSIRQAVRDVPSAQTDLDEFCFTCKEYDQEKHCCPRWNRVIRETAEEVRKNAEPRWIPIEERLPEENGLYLVTVEGSQNGEVFERAVDYADFMFSGGYIDNFNTVNDWIEYGEWHVTAWMPLPKPYERSEDE